MYGWGDNSYFKLADDFFDWIPKPTKMVFDEEIKVSEVLCSSNHVCALYYKV